VEEPCEDRSEVARLKRRLERERLARAEAEVIAEQGLRALYARQRAVELLQAVAGAANEADSLEPASSLVLEQVCNYTEWPVGHAYLVAPGDAGRLEPSSAWFFSDPDRFEPFRRVTMAMPLARGNGLPGLVLETGQPHWIEDVSTSTAFPRARLMEGLGVHGAFAFPVMAGTEIAAVLEFFLDRPAPPDPCLLELLADVGKQLGRVAERCRARDDIRMQLGRLGALRTIDLAISGSMDLNLTMVTLLNEVLAQLSVDAADVLLCRPNSPYMRRAAAKGFRSSALPREEAVIGRGPAGRAALERRTVEAPDLGDAGPEFREGVPDGDGFRAYFAAPLVAKGQVRGVLEVFHRTPLRPNAEWLEFLQALAGQAAIAVDNGTLLDRLQKSNMDLVMAYDATIEGWSRALDLRDHETEGHTRRVTEMTMRLARAMNVPDDDLVHMRRGALLHDIGKMGIPDQILLKPGRLTAEETQVMRLHANYAMEMLGPISFLRAALDIPYCHHEKWDGSGYPRGLREEQIPLAARIFSVVDVWDALGNDRLYRQAWPQERVRAYLRDHSGAHFDPAVVDAFEALLDAEPPPD
jgi:putative nucleotidyltransferase with HDIG domain